MSEGAWWPLRGASMWPLQAPLEAQLERTDQLVVGDIIGFIGDRPGILVLHRVVAIGAGGVQARGDTNLACDPLVPRQAILGKLAALRLGALVFALPQHGYPAWLLRRAGVGWSQVAPHLRKAVAGLRHLG